MENEFIESISYKKDRFLSQRVTEHYSVSSTDSIIINSSDFEIRTSSHDEKENQPLLANFEDNDLNEYENNELVQNTIQELNKFFATVKCQCSNNNKENKKCFEVVGFKQFFERHLQFRALSREELEAVLMGQILAFQCDGNIKSDGHCSCDF
ncbi:3700_t:CDS:1 [Paraglomus brasilianum]|uniref:3700_t:CDS:1 n=1 Tax=Paraglomus brasilianum TaxID=144538 RepID=A0A9N9D8V3_9GLOM|nr:3700_t:CDS:1 [Paraglomus brasilianum]